MIRLRPHRTSRIAGNFGKTLFNSLIALTVEGFGYVLLFLLASGLFRLGLSAMAAIGLSAVLIVIGVLLSLFIQKGGNKSLAARLGRSLPHHPQLWHDYQDWLHDILCDRQRLLEQGKSPLWVMILTTWRLKRLGFAVGWSYVSNKVATALKSWQR